MELIPYPSKRQLNKARICCSQYIRIIHTVLATLIFRPSIAGSSQFNDIVQKDDFLDRSRFLELLFTESTQPDNPVYISAPSQFGKTTLVSMMEQFYGIQTHVNGTPVSSQAENKYFDLFTKTYSRGSEKTKLFIAKSKSFDDHFGKYPVLSLDFKDLKIESHIAFLESLQSELHEASKKYNFLLNSTVKLDRFASEILSGSYYPLKRERRIRKALTIGIRNLTAALFQHFGNRKCIILIDSLDGPLSKMLTSTWIDYEFLEICETLATFIRNIFVKSKDYLAAGFLTGRTRHGGFHAHRSEIIKYFRFSENFRIASSFGLPTSNVASLLSRFKTTESLANLRENFGGYRVKNTEMEILITKPTIETIKKGGLTAPLNLGLSDESLSCALRLDHAGLEVLRACAGENITIRLSQDIGLLNILDLNDNFQTLESIKANEKNYTEENVRRFLEYLHDLGYFTTPDGRPVGLTQLVIPNSQVHENLIRGALTALVDEFNLKKSELKEMQLSFERLNNSTIRFQEFRHSVERVFHDVRDKSLTASHVRGILFVGLLNAAGVSQLEAVSEGEGGRKPMEQALAGRLTFVIPSSETAVAMDVQVDGSSSSALQQIVNDKLSKEISKFKNRIMLGLNLDLKNNSVSCSFLYDSEVLGSTIPSVNPS